MKIDYLIYLTIIVLTPTSIFHTYVPMNLLGESLGFQYMAENLLLKDCTSIFQVNIVFSTKTMMILMMYCLSQASLIQIALIQLNYDRQSGVMSRSSRRNHAINWRPLSSFFFLALFFNHWINFISPS